MPEAEIVHLFNQIQSRDDMDFTLTASYLEIYNEKVVYLQSLLRG